MIARLALTLGLALCASVQAQDLVGSYVKLEAQVVGPAASPTLNSTNDLTGNDWVNWTQYFASRESAPWAADGEQSVPSGHGWRAGQLKAPPNTSVQWKVGGSWLTSEPASGTAVTAVRWHTDPMLKIDFGVTGTSTDFSGTGDGFRIIPYKLNFYVVNHHSDSRHLNCRSAKTGAPCAGFPADGTGLSLTEAGPLNTNDQYFAPHHPMEALNYATGELFVGVVAKDNTARILCTNLDTLQGCGSWVLASVAYGLGEDEPAVNLETIGSKYFVLTRNGSLHCFDIVSRATCGSTSYVAATSGGDYPPLVYYTSTQLAGKMFFSTGLQGTSNPRMWCHDPATAAPCAGWNNTGFASGNLGGALPIPNPDGSPRGVCSSDGVNCRAINGTPFSLSAAASNYIYNNSGWTTLWFQLTFSVNLNAIQGSRIYTPRGFKPFEGSPGGYGVNCFDFATDSVCPGFPRNTSMVDLAYSTRFDPTRPNCLLVIGDSAVGYQFNVNTLGACSDPGLSTEPKTLQVTPANYYKCDPTNAQVTGWDAVRVSPTLTWGGLSGLSEIKVTLKDGGGVTLPAAYNPVRTFTNGSFSLDISDVPYSLYPGLTVVFQMSSAGNLSSATPVGVDVTWKGPPRQLCFQTQAPSTVACETASTLTVTTALATAPATALETVVVDKVLSPGSGSEGYAAAAVATSTRALSTALSSGESKTYVLQGRYDLKNFSGDLWALSLNAELQLDTDDIKKASAGTPAPGSRKMFLAKPDGSGTAGSMSLVALEFANASASQQAALNRSLAGLTDTLGSARVAYLRGTDGTFRARTGGALGPVINSAPMAIPQRAIAGLSEANHPGYAAYRRDVSRSSPMVVWGGSDGAVHAAEVTGAGLTEAWSLVPDVMLRKAAQFSDPTAAAIRLNPHFVDNQPMVGHANTGSASTPDWRTVAVVTFGRGARGITAIDVTKSDLSLGKGVLFEYTNATHPDLSDLGYIVSPPIWSEALGSHQIVKLSDGRWAVLVGNGIDSNDQSAGMAGSGTGRPVLYAFYLDGGSPRWRRFAVDQLLGGAPNAALSTQNGLSTPRPVDIDGDGKVDIAYAGDIKGNLWRFDLKNLASPSVSKLYAAGPARPIQAAPLVVRNGTSGVCPDTQVNGCWQVIVGTGAYLSPLQGTTNTTTQRLVSVLDLGGASTVADASLVAQPYNVATGSAGVEFRVSDGAPVDYPGGKRGWTLALGAKEHAVSSPVLQPNGQLRMTTVRPLAAGASATLCVPARSWVFEMNPAIGRPAADTFDYNNDQSINELDRVAATGSTVPRPPLAMAVTGAQFSTPATLLGPKVSSNTAFMLFPSLNIDTSTNTGGAAGASAAITGGKPVANGMARSGDRKALGRASWRLVR